MHALFNLMLVLYATAVLWAVLLWKYRQWNNLLTNLSGALASLCGIVFAVGHLSGASASLNLINIESSIPYISFALKTDHLSAFFILCLSLLSLCVAVYSAGYMKHYAEEKSIGLFNALFNIFLLSMTCLITASNIITFLICWEIMSLVSYGLVVFERESLENSQAGLIYLIMTHLGTAFLITAFMLIYINTGNLGLDPAGNSLSPLVKNSVFILLLLGFGVKAGIIPLHVWLPYAHPAAPSNVSALMSGMMIKTAIYGMIRFMLVVLGGTAIWWGVVIIIIGSISTVLGVAYALMEHNYKRLLAYHSIENIGIILIGLGVALTAYAGQHLTTAAIALLAALFHLINHTLFKGALFLGAGALQFATHTKDLEELGGLIKKMPYTAFFMLLASLCISAFPPFNGFVSEWLTFQALFHNLNIASAGLKLLSILSVAALAMAGALTAACFVKFIGIAFLGLARSEHAQKAREVPISMLSGMGLLTLLCLIFGIFPHLITSLLDRINQDLLSTSILPGLQGKSFWTYYPLTVNSTGISPLFAILLGILIFFICYALVRFCGRKTKERIYDTWDCGFGGVNSRMQYTATGFSKPIRIVFRMLYRPHRELQHIDGASPYYPSAINYFVSTEPVFEKYIYHPLADLATRWAGKARWYIQTGSVHIYLLYIFLTLIILLIYNKVA